MRGTLAEKLWSKATADGTGCWIWRGAVDSGGYGRLNIVVDGKRTTVAAHRVAYEIVVGPIPDGLVLDHLCRVRLCINPKHQEPVTERENILRGTGFAARNAAKTHCHRGHELDGANLYISPNTGWRRCHACRRLTNSYRVAAPPSEMPCAECGLERRHQRHAVVFGMRRDVYYKPNHKYVPTYAVLEPDDKREAVKA